ncbi:MAG: hypothetical protein ACYCPA_02280 [Acidithiobacillus sp.]
MRGLVVASIRDLAEGFTPAQAEAFMLAQVAACTPGREVASMQGQAVASIRDLEVASIQAHPLLMATKARGVPASLA